MDIKISVIIPIYKVEKYIERCARSLFEQTMMELEFIFVNDNTPDKSMQILRHVIADYPNRMVKIIDLDTNRGVANARNVGLDNAKGEYIGFVDSDDWIDVETYSSLYASAQGRDICGCNFINEYPDKSIVFKQKYSLDKNENLRHLIEGDIFPSLCTEIVKRELYNKNNIRFHPNLNAAEDLYVNVCLFIVAKDICCLNVEYYHYRHFGESLTSKISNGNIESGVGIARLIEKKMKENGIYEPFECSILYREFITKLGIWTISHDAQRWRDTFPASHKHIFGYKRVTWKIKVECCLVALYLDSVALAFSDFLKWQHKIKTS